MLNNNIFFRLDANKNVGFGHLSRCLCLANALRKRGALIFFIVKKDKEARKEVIKNNYTIFEIDGDLSETNDALASKEIISSYGKNNTVIVDHYELTEKWEQKIKKHCSFLVAIDDYPYKTHWADIVIDQDSVSDNIFPKEYLLNFSANLLSGYRYLLIEPEKRAQYTNGKISGVVYFGSSDNEKNTVKVIRALAKENFPKDDMIIVCGKYNKHVRTIQKLCSSLGFSCVRHVDHFQKLLSGAKFFIGAGGMSMWDAVICCVPTMAVSIADNQYFAVSQLEKNNCITTVHSDKASIKSYSALLRKFNRVPFSAHRWKMKKGLGRSALGVDLVAEKMVERIDERR